MVPYVAILHKLICFNCVINQTAYNQTGDYISFANEYM